MNDTNPPNGRRFRPFGGLVSRAGLAGGGAQNMTRCQPMLTHPSWVNIKEGWYEMLPIPVEQLKRVADANSNLVDAARRLVDLAGQTEDQAFRAKLLIDLGRILTSSQAISGVVQAAGQPSSRHR